MDLPGVGRQPHGIDGLVERRTDVDLAALEDELPR